MGQMRFLAPQRDRVSREVAQRAYMAGIEGIPWHSRNSWQNDELVIQRELGDSGNLHVPWLVEGHGDYVMDAVGPAVVPSVAQIRERFSSRRSSAGRMEQAIRRILGIDLKMKQYAQGSRFVKTVVDEAGMATFNKVWGSPQSLPTKEEFVTPQLWLDRVGRGDALPAGG